jgi:hypothetical protein
LIISSYCVPGSSGCAARFEVVDALVKVAEEAGAGAALLHALGQVALADALFAKGALFDDALFGVEVAHAVGAGHDAELATDALRLVDLNRAVLANMGRLGGAHLHAFGVFAVLALNGKEVHLDIGVLA